MTKEERNHNELLEIMEAIESIDSCIAVSEAIQHIPFDTLTPDLWDDVQNMQELTGLVLARFKETLVMGSKIIDNDAVRAHLETVLLTDV